MERKFIFCLILLLFCLVTSETNAQNVGIANTSIVPDASSMLEVRATDKGLLIPRVALTGVADMVTIPLPANSLLVYNTGTAGLAPAGYYYNTGTPAAPNWRRLATDGEAWSLTGNSGTVAGTNFIGTVDAIDWVVKTNNAERMRVLSSGNVGIGTLAPTNKLHVDGLGTTTAIYGQYDANRYAYLAGPTYGTYSYMNTGTAAGYGGYFYTTNSATAGYGIYARSDYTGAANSSYTYGAYVNTQSTTQDQYGIYNTATHSGTGGFLYGIGNYASQAAGNTTNQYGLYNYSTRGADDATNYGIYSYVNNGTTTYGLYSNATGGTTNWAGYFDGRNVYIANNCGIGTTAPISKVHVMGSITLQDGTQGLNKVLVSDANGTGTWQALSQHTFGTNNQGVKGTTDITLNTTAWQDMAQMTITFTPAHNLVYVLFTFSAYANPSYYPMMYVDFQVLRDGVSMGASNCLVEDYDDVDGLVTSFNGAMNMAVPVTAGVSTTIKVQWRRDGLYLGPVYCNAATFPDFCHRVLTIID